MSERSQWVRVLVRRANHLVQRANARELSQDHMDRIEAEAIFAVLAELADLRRRDKSKEDNADLVLRVRAEKAEAELAELRHFAEDMATCLGRGQQCWKCPLAHTCDLLPPRLRYRARYPEDRHDAT